MDINILSLKENNTVKKVVIETKSGYMDSFDLVIDTLSITKNGEASYLVKTNPIYETSIQCTFKAPENKDAFEKLSEQAKYYIDNLYDNAWLDGPVTTFSLFYENGAMESESYPVPIEEFKKVYDILQKIKARFLASLGDLLNTEE